MASVKESGSVGVMGKDDFILNIIINTGVKKPVAELIVRRLEDEGLLLTPSFGDKTVNLIITTFKDAFGTTKTTRYDRYSASRLASRHTADVVCQVIVLMAGSASEPYAPVINNVSELETKWISVVSHIKKQNVQPELDANE